MKKLLVLLGALSLVVSACGGVATVPTNPASEPSTSTSVTSAPSTAAPTTGAPTTATPSTATPSTTVAATTTSTPESSAIAYFLRAELSNGDGPSWCRSIAPSPAQTP